MPAITNEQNARLDILNSILSAPHADMGKLKPLHANAINNDPLFYGHFAAWYVMGNGEVRDHRDAFIGHLLTSNHKEHRDAGFELLQDLAPYEVRNIQKYINEHVGKHPRSTRTAVRYYLRKREEDKNWLERAIMSNRDDMKGLYASAHIKPSKLAQEILFDDNPPVDSLPYKVKIIAKSEDPNEQARLIAKLKIPYSTAKGAIKKMTPPVMIALVQNMSPQEVINNLDSLKKKGALDNPDVKALIEKKIDESKSYKRASTLKAKLAYDRVDDESIKAKLVDSMDTRLKKKGTIKRPTALFVDKSGSLDVAIELSKQLCTVISTVMEAPFYVYAFDEVAFPIDSTGKTIEDWNSRFKFIMANGPTSIGAPLSAMIAKKQYVEQIIIVTDENENEYPHFVDEYRKYRDALKSLPEVLIIDVGHYSTRLQEQLKSEKILFNKYIFNGDYTSLPNIIPLVAKPSKLELLNEIMSTPLPVRTYGYNTAPAKAKAKSI